MRNKVILTLGVLILFAAFFIPPAYATPAGEVTYSKANFPNIFKDEAFTTNFNHYVSIGGYDVYQIGDRLCFYQDGVYVKDVVNPIATGNPIISPYKWNSTFLICAIGDATYLGSNQYQGLKLYYLNIVSNAWTAISSYVHVRLPYPSREAIYRMVGGTLYYAVVCATTYPNYGLVWFSWDGVTLTSGYVNIASWTYHVVDGPTIFINSNSSSQEVYFLIADYTNLNRVHIYKYNFVTTTVTDIGACGTSYSWGYFTEGTTSDSQKGFYVYYIGSEYVVWNAGTQHAYFVFLAYPTNLGNDTVIKENLKFNDTSIETKIIGKGYDGSPSQLTVRPISSPPLSGINVIVTGGTPNPKSLDYATYLFFTGAGYNLVATGGEGLWSAAFENFYDSPSVGGYQNEASTTAIFIDYTNSKVAPLKMPAYAGAGLYDLEYKLIKAPSTVTGFIYGLYTDTTYYYQFNLTKNYDFVVGGHVNMYFDNVLKASGINIISSKGAFAFSIASNKAGAVHNMTLYFFDHSVSTTTAQVTANYNFFVYASVNGTSTTPTNPWTTTGTPTGPSDIQIRRGVSWLLMIIVFMPAIILGFLGSKQSADASIFLGMIGMGLSFGLNYLIVYEDGSGAWVHPVPDWIIIFLFVALTFAILYGVINKAGGGSRGGERPSSKGGGESKK